MPARYVWIILGACLSASAGCSKSASNGGAFAYENNTHRYHRPAGPLQASLLFDRIPGVPTAMDFNARSDWPSTQTGYRGRETLYYVTYVNDRQGYGWHDHNFYHRSARYYQVGSEER
jgi:hypothetical protein